MSDLHPNNTRLLAALETDLDFTERDRIARDRLRRLLPNFPVQVVDDWLVRHGEHAFELYGWLDYGRLAFRRDLFTTPFLLENVQTGNERAVRCWAGMIIDDAAFRESDLGRFMIERGTWPVPPTVLEDGDHLAAPSAETLGRYHLLEGHHRLAYLKGLANSPGSSVQHRHEIWLASYDA